MTNKSTNDLMKSLEITAKTLASNPALNIPLQSDKIKNSFSTVQELSRITQQFSSIFSGNDSMLESFKNTYNFQAQLLQNTQNFYLTETVKSFRYNLSHNNYFEAIEAISKSLKLPEIAAPNIALLKLNEPLMNLTEFKLPKGMSSLIKNLHVSTAEGLSMSDNISYDCNKASFFIDTEPKSNFTAKEANVIYSVARLFDELTEEELVLFLRHLSSFYSLGTSHCTGEKIMKIVKNIESVISFDSDLYYHARSLDDGVCPFTDEDMTCAPHGITSFGRFNHVGENYFYFSNQQKGAIEEVRKHSPKNRVQVAELKTKGKVQMVDISHEKENTFLKYCRFPFDPKSGKKVPREYLIPSFFSDCCKFYEFDGIKYYGTKDYHNYVTWSDGHFKFVNQEIL